MFDHRLSSSSMTICLFSAFMLTLRRPSPKGICTTLHNRVKLCFMKSSMQFVKFHLKISSLFFEPRFSLDTNYRKRWIPKLAMAQLSKVMYVWQANLSPSFLPFLLSIDLGKTMILRMRLDASISCADLARSLTELDPKTWLTSVLHIDAKARL